MVNMMKFNKRTIGNIGEEMAVKYLIKNKYRILERNFRCKLGEIDIIAKDGVYIVFVEVKMRKNSDFGMPAEAVNFYKQRKIIQVAQYYLMSKGIEYNIRFDIVEILANIEENKTQIKNIRIIKNAFQVC